MPIVCEQMEYPLPAQDSDERAVAYIAGQAPSRWGAFGADPPVAAPTMVVAPPVLSPNASVTSIDKAKVIRRAHPLYADVSLRLLTEIMNSRLFTTVRCWHNHACPCAPTAAQCTRYADDMAQELLACLQLS